MATGNNKKLQLGWARKIITGFEPAGGWTTLNKIMTPIAIATAKAKDHKFGPKKVKNSRPIKVVVMCPITTFRGWENGASG